MSLNYRKGVGVFLLNKKKQVWVGKRLDIKNNFWQMPQGGIDSGESEKEAMMRELSESRSCWTWREGHLTSGCWSLWQAVPVRGTRVSTLWRSV